LIFFILIPKRGIIRIDIVINSESLGTVFEKRHSSLSEVIILLKNLNQQITAQSIAATPAPHNKACDVTLKPLTEKSKVFPPCENKGLVMVIIMKRAA
jgi:phage regulator Rha-like protein